MLGRAHRPFRQVEETVEAGTTVVLGFPGAGGDPRRLRGPGTTLSSRRPAPRNCSPGRQPGRPGPAPRARLIPAPLTERLPADPRRLPAMRRRLGLERQAALSDDTTADLQLLLSGRRDQLRRTRLPGRSPGEFRYSVRRRDDGTIRVEVQDFGRWRPPPADPGTAAGGSP